VEKASEQEFWSLHEASDNTKSVLERSRIKQDMAGENTEQNQAGVGSVEEKIVTLKIQLPNNDVKLEIPCSIDDPLYEIMETLKVLPSTREYTAYELRIGAQVYNEETIVSELLVNEGDESVIVTLVPSPYTEVTARKHVIEARQYAGLDSNHDSILEISGVAAGASTFEDLELLEQQETPKTSENATDETKETKESEEAENPKHKVSDEERAEISKLVSEIITTEEDVFILAAKKTIKPSAALKSLYISQWSPADLSRKLAGDLFYLQAQTLEGEHLYITAHVSGFFINKSSNSKFDGSIANHKSGISFNYSLISLFKAISPLFEQQLEKNAQLLAQHAAETYLVPNTTILSAPWLVKDIELPTADLGKSQYNLLHGGMDGADLQIDWNKNYQLVKDISKENLSQRFSREQTLISTSAEFTTAAVRGAMAVVRGEIQPVNLEEDPDYNIYLRNGIFYSKAIDSINQFINAGGEEAARAATSKDVNNLRHLNKYDFDGVHTLLTTVVDYLGQRIVCQAPVPGIFSANEATPEESEVEPEQAVKYGFIDDHSDVAGDEDFANAFKAIGEAFHLKPHKVWNNDGSKVVDVVTSAYTKGTKGTDERKYIIDVFRTTPLDIEFIDENFDQSKEDSYPHRETVLRHEAVNEWIKRETAVAIRKETERLEKEGKVDSETKPTIGIDDSLFLLNPDAFSLTSAPTPEFAKELREDEDKVREVSKFVSQVLVPEFVKDMEKSEVYNAIDGTHLCALLHESGINIRYLGKIAKLSDERKSAYLKEQETKLAEITKTNEEILAEEEKELAEKKAKLESKIQARKEAAEKGEPIPDFKEELEAEAQAEKEKEKAESELPTKLSTISVATLLSSLYKVSVTEMVARATKHFLRKQLATLPAPLAPDVISHVHNCLLASAANPTPEAPELNFLLKQIYKDVDLSILNADSETVLSAIAKEVYIRFRYNLPENWIESIKTIQLMKSIATKFGIQWRVREYAFTKEQLDAQVAKHAAVESFKNEEKHSKKKGKKTASSTKKEEEVKIVRTTFTPEDILCLTPVVKNSVYEATSISDAWEAGILKLSSKDQEEIQEGAVFANQSLQFAERLYGPVHAITASYSTKLGNLYQNSNDSVDALYLLKKAFQTFERCAGIDSYQASLALNQLASAYLSNNEIANTLKIYKRLIKYWMLAFDEYHPNITNLLTSAAIILMRVDMNVESTKVFERALALSDEANGEISQQSAFFRYQLAQTYFAEKRTKEALEAAEKSFAGYKATLGLKDKSTIDSRRLASGLKNYIDYLKVQAKNSQEKEQEARKLEQQQNIKTKQAHKAKQATPNAELASKSIDDIMAFIGGSSDSKKKKNNKKKGSKK
jgi:protein TIF31